MFANLKSLNELTITNSVIEYIEVDFLDSIKGNLRSLTITAKETSNASRSLNSIFETTHFSNLDYVRIRDNLKNTIEQNTFNGLVHVDTLVLAWCQIESIGPKSFDKLPWLTRLDLSHNLLKSIPSGLFLKLSNRMLSIDIGNNPWRCNCELEEFQQFLRQYNVFHGPIECATPECMKLHPVVSTTFCNLGNDIICSPSTTEVQLNLNHPRSIKESTYIVKECYDDLAKSCEEVQIKGQSKILSLTYEENGDIQIEIVNDYEASNYVVIWFETVKTSSENNEIFESSETVSCQSSDSRSFRIRNLYPDTAYTVCIVSKTETTISPLDCFPYYNQTVFDTNEEDIWILEDDKVKVISFVVCGAIGSLLFGVAMSFVLIRKNPTWLRGNDRVLPMSKDPNSDVMIMPPEWSRPAVNAIPDV